MCIPKANKSPETLAQESKSVSLARGRPAVVFARLRPITPQLLAGAIIMLASLLMAPLQLSAAQLDTTALAGPETTSLATVGTIAMISTRHVSNHASGLGSSLHLENGFLEADLSDFATGVARDKDGNTGKPRVTEFSSVGVSSMTPFGLPLQVIKGTEDTPLAGVGSAAAGMPIMVLVWLFGVGLIG